MKLDYLETIGWYGVFAILTAYILVSFQIIQSNTVIFQVLNFTGAIAIIVDAYNDKNYQPVVLNIIWAVIAFLALLRLLPIM